MNPSDPQFTSATGAAAAPYGSYKTGAATQEQLQAQTNPFLRSATANSNVDLADLSAAAEAQAQTAALAAQQAQTSQIPVNSNPFTAQEPVAFTAPSMTATTAEVEVPVNIPAVLVASATTTSVPTVAGTVASNELKAMPIAESAGASTSAPATSDEQWEIDSDAEPTLSHVAHEAALAAGKTLGFISVGIKAAARRLSNAGLTQENLAHAADTATVGAMQAQEALATATTKIVDAARDIDTDAVKQNAAVKLSTAQAVSEDAVNNAATTFNQQVAPVINQAADSAGQAVDTSAHLAREAESAAAPAYDEAYVRAHNTAAQLPATMSDAAHKAYNEAAAAALTVADSAAQLAESVRTKAAVLADEGKEKGHEVVDTTAETYNRNIAPVVDESKKEADANFQRAEVRTEEMLHNAIRTTVNAATAAAALVSSAVHSAEARIAATYHAAADATAPARDAVAQNAIATKDMVVNKTAAGVTATRDAGRYAKGATVAAKDATTGAIASGVNATTGAVASGVNATTGAVASGVNATTGAVASGVNATTGAVASGVNATTGAIAYAGAAVIGAASAAGSKLYHMVPGTGDVVAARDAAIDAVTPEIAVPLPAQFEQGAVNNMESEIVQNASLEEISYAEEVERSRREGRTVGMQALVHGKEEALAFVEGMRVHLGEASTLPALGVPRRELIREAEETEREERIDSADFERELAADQSRAFIQGIANSSNARSDAIQSRDINEFSGSNTQFSGNTNFSTANNGIYDDETRGAEELAREERIVDEQTKLPLAREQAAVVSSELDDVRLNHVARQQASESSNFRQNNFDQNNFDQTNFDQSNFAQNNTGSLQVGNTGVMDTPNEGAISPPPTPIQPQEQGISRSTPVTSLPSKASSSTAAEMYLGAEGMNATRGLASHEFRANVEPTTHDGYEEVLGAKISRERHLPESTELDTIKPDTAFERGAERFPTPPANDANAPNRQLPGSSGLNKEYGLVDSESSLSKTGNAGASRLDTRRSSSGSMNRDDGSDNSMTSPNKPKKVHGMMEKMVGKMEKGLGKVVHSASMINSGEEKVAAGVAELDAVRAVKKAA